MKKTIKKQTHYDFKKLSNIFSKPDLVDDLHFPSDKNNCKQGGSGELADRQEPEVEDSSPPFSPYQDSPLMSQDSPPAEFESSLWSQTFSPRLEPEIYLPPSPSPINNNLLSVDPISALPARHPKFTVPYKNKKPPRGKCVDWETCVNCSLNYDCGECVNCSDNSLQ